MSAVLAFTLHDEPRGMTHAETLAQAKHQRCAALYRIAAAKFDQLAAGIEMLAGECAIGSGMQSANLELEQAAKALASADAQIAYSQQQLVGGAK